MTESIICTAAKSVMLDGYIDISRYLFLKKHNWHAVFLILAWSFMYGLYNKSEEHYKIVHFPISVTLYLQFFLFQWNGTLHNYCDILVLLQL